MRQAALEAFVRICFLTHYLCSDRLNKRFKSPNNLAKADPKLVYIAAAIEAVIAVIQHDPCRGTRYAAAMTLLGNYDIVFFYTNTNTNNDTRCIARQTIVKITIIRIKYG